MSQTSVKRHKPEKESYKPVKKTPENSEKNDKKSQSSVK